MNRRVQESDSNVTYDPPVSHMHRLLIVALVSWVGLAACSRRVKPIDLHDETIPIEARRLVADAEDSIAIARANLEEAKRNLGKTRQWRDDLLNRDWPSEASSALQKLQRLASARVELADLQVEKAEQEVELAEAKYELVTAKTAIRHDLAIYELDRLRKRMTREEEDVETLGAEIASRRKRIAQLSNKWWDAYGAFVQGGGESRALYVAAAEEIPARQREIRRKRQQEAKSDSEGSESGKSDTGESTPDISEIAEDSKKGSDKSGAEGDGESESAGESESE